MYYLYKATIEFGLGHARTCTSKGQGGMFPSMTNRKLGREYQFYGTLIRDHVFIVYLLPETSQRPKMLRES